MAGPLDEFDEIIKVRQGLYDAMMEGTPEAKAEVNRKIRPLVRAWQSKILLLAEPGKTLQAYLQSLPEKWYAETEVLLDLADKPGLLPIMRATPAKELEGLPSLQDPSAIDWRIWLDDYGDRVGLTMRRPFASTRRPLLTAVRVVGAVVATTALVLLGRGRGRGRGLTDG